MKRYRRESARKKRRLRRVEMAIPVSESRRESDRARTTRRCIRSLEYFGLRLPRRRSSGGQGTSTSRVPPGVMTLVNSDVDASYDSTCSRTWLHRTCEKEADRKGRFSSRARTKSASFGSVRRAARRKSPSGSTATLLPSTPGLGGRRTVPHPASRARGTAEELKQGTRLGKPVVRPTDISSLSLALRFSRVNSREVHAKVRDHGPGGVPASARRRDAPCTGRRTAGCS